MIGSIIEASIALAIAIGSAIYAVGGVNANNKSNEKAIEDLKDAMIQGQDELRKTILQYHEQMIDMIEKNMSDMKEMLDKEKNNSREALQNEIAHLRELVNINAMETRADIQRLQLEQKESNNLKTKVALISSSVRALHHRLDLDPPTLLDDND